MPGEKRYSPTTNKYIWVDRGNAIYNAETNSRDFSPFLNKEYLKRYVAQNHNLGRVKQSEKNSISNIKLYFDVNREGFKSFASNFILV